jgi:pyrimidine operon attenuation protein / uracil phosphoribosyltransferase
MRKIKRMAYEIYEHNVNEKDLVLAGIFEKGFIFAQMLRDEIKQISPIDPVLVNIKLDKTTAIAGEIELDCNNQDLHQKAVIICDDVMNTGKTMMHALKPFMNIELKKLEMAVLINRSHLLYPVFPQYTGYELSTTIEEHIEASLESMQKEVYLH